LPEKARPSLTGDGSAASPRRSISIHSEAWSRLWKRPQWGVSALHRRTGGAEEYASTAPWIAIFPGAVIALTVFGFSLFGDALRDALDPKPRDR
jgi:hypothetical protein